MKDKSRCTEAMHPIFRKSSDSAFPLRAQHPEDAADAALPLDQQIASGKTAIIVPQGFVDSVMRETYSLEPR